MGYFFNLHYLTFLLCVLILLVCLSSALLCICITYTFLPLHFLNLCGWHRTHFYCMLSETSNQRVNWTFFSTLLGYYQRETCMYLNLVLTRVCSTVWFFNQVYSKLLRAIIMMTAVVYLFQFIMLLALVFICSLALDCMVVAFRITVHKLFRKFCNMSARSVCWKLLLILF